MFTLQIVDEHAISADRDRAIREALCRSFPADRGVFEQTRAWHGSAPSVSIVMVDTSDSVVAHLGIHERVVRLAGDRYRAAGIQNVCVDPAHRGQRLGDRLLQEADEVLRQRGFDIGLLFCHAGLVPLYHRHGWQEAPALIVVRTDETGDRSPLPAGNVTMVLPVRREPELRGELDLCGNDW